MSTLLNYLALFLMFNPRHDFDDTHGGPGGECNNEGIMSYGNPPAKWSTCSNNDFLNWWRSYGFVCMEEVKG